MRGGGEGLQSGPARGLQPGQPNNSHNAHKLLGLGALMSVVVAMTTMMLTSSQPANRF